MEVRRVSSFHSLCGSRSRTRVIGLGSNCIYLLSHLAGPWLALKNIYIYLANYGAEKNIRAILNGDVSGNIFSLESLGANK